MMNVIASILGIFLFSFVFTLIMYKLKKQQLLGDIQIYCENKVPAKFDTGEISIDEAVNKEFELIDF